MKYTREELQALYQEGLRDKEKVVDEYVGSIVTQLIYLNTRGEKKYIKQIWKEDLDVLEKIVNKLKEIFVDSAIGTYNTSTDFTVIEVDWTIVN